MSRAPRCNPSEALPAQEFSLTMRRTWPDGESFHIVKQCDALQSESRGCSLRTAELPISVLSAACGTLPIHRFAIHPCPFVNL